MSPDLPLRRFAPFVPMLACAVLSLAAVPSVAAQDAAVPSAPVARVDVVREPIFDARQGALARVGNALHVRTRDFVVRRELLVRAGQPYDSLKVLETVRNLRATGVFRRVLVDTTSSVDGTVVRVTTRDGFSLRPTASLTTSSGQSSYSVGLADDNFLGLAATLSTVFQSTPDRNQLTVAYRQPRAFDDRIGISTVIDARSDGRGLGALVNQPFFTLSTRRAWDVSASQFNGTVLVFRDGALSQNLRRHFAIARADYAIAPVASSLGYLRLGVSGQLRRDDFLTAPVAAGTPFPSTVTGTVGLFASAERARYLVLHNVRSFLREEDVAIGPRLSVAVLASPTAFGYTNNGVGLSASARIGTGIPGGYALLSAAANGRFAGGLDSGRVVTSATVVVQPGAQQALLGGVQVGRQRAAVPGEQFDLGLGVGLRAYPLHAFTGDRYMLVGGEYRINITDDAAGLLGLGLAAFGTWAGAWYADEARRTGTELGLGLRWGFTRGTDGTVRRIDLVHRSATAGLAGGWSLVIGEGFAF